MIPQVSEETSPMRNSGYSSSNPKSYEDDDLEFFDADDIESPKPTFVFKLEYQTREILKALDKVDAIGDYVAFGSAQKSKFCDVEESAFIDFDEANCGSVREVEVDQGFRDVVFEEQEVVIEEGSVSDDEKTNELQFSSEDDLVSEDEVVSSDSICLSQDDDDDDKLGALEDIGLHKPDGFDVEDDNIKEQLRELEESCKGEEKTMDGDNGSGSGDLDAMEALWEHQELIDQLKMEFKRVRATTDLPTIPEESEFVNMDDLRSLKVDEKYQHGDTMRELHELHKSYRTQMRELDILSYQKLDALSVLRKESFSRCKSSAPTIKSFLSNLKLCRPKIVCDPIVKFIKDLRSEMEVAYVGQLCLSWEFLTWQYEKALELLESDPCQIHSYNEVAVELQQFQVLLQRFVEDEHFQGPRVDNYVRNRCAMDKLLEVPVIRQDTSEERSKGNAITTDILVETLAESIKNIWRFIRADRDANITTATRKRSLDGDCLDPNLLAEVQADLRKKERILKELKRRENRILKRFQKHEEGEEEEDNADHHGHLSFFPQVDIRLVSRVLNMSTVTHDQLVWCQRKLSKIQFVKHKIHVDPYFLLFPC